MWLTQLNTFIVNNYKYSTGCDHGGFFKTKPSLASPDLQMRFLPAQAITADGMGTFTKFKETANLKDGFSFQSIVARPESCGEITLKSNDIRDKPLIDVGYLRYLPSHRGNKLKLEF